MAMEFSLKQARRYMTRLHFGSNKTVFEAVSALGSVQYDPLNIVGRNPDLVMQSRVKNYKPSMLHAELYDKRTLLEGFDKMLCIFPKSDYIYLGRLRDSTSAYFRQNPEVQNSVGRVISEITQRGALCSDDIDLEGKVRWPWGEATLARAGLETLWMDGRLVIHHRVGNRRYYDLAERHIPADILNTPDPNDTIEKYFAWQLRRRIRSIGMLRNAASDAFLGLDGFKAESRNAAFEALLGDKTITEVKIDGSPFYVPTENLPMLSDGKEAPTSARFLGPLDNFMWDRKLINRVFGFEYSWEVYTPREKRKYGYYVLPVMYRDEFAARFEPANFRGGKLRVLNWWWEDGFKRTKQAEKAISACMTRFCEYLGADGTEE